MLSFFWFNSNKMSSCSRNAQEIVEEIFRLFSLVNSLFRSKTNTKLTIFPVSVE